MHHTHTHTQPFVQHHLEKTTIRNQKAKQDQGEFSSLYTIPNSIYGRLFASLSLSLSLSLTAVKASVDAHVLDVSPPFWSIFKQIWVYAVSVFMVLGVTLSLFPSVISIIESTVPNPKASHWTGQCRSLLMDNYRIGENFR